MVAHNDDLGYFLKVSESFDVPTRLYGDVDAVSERFMNTFVERSKKRLGTGILLYGVKGSGKSLAAKLTCLKAVEMGYPILQITNRFAGGPFTLFMQSITQPCVVLFDEFEKTYGRFSRDEDAPSEGYAQEALLGLFDGPFSGEKLMILTANDRWSVDQHFLNRPGRIFYSVQYDGIKEEFVREYCQENLRQCDQIETVISLSHIFKDFNFDMLQALVEEMNRYNEPAKKALKLLNIEPDPLEMVRYDVEATPLKSKKKLYVYPSVVNRPLHCGVTTLELGVLDGDAVSKITGKAATTHLRVDFAMEGAISRDMGTLVVEKDGYKITATRQKERQFDYGHLL